MLGVLLDVSGSMRSAYSTGDTEYDASVQRTHTLFTTIANIVGDEVANHRRQEKIFVCGFGLKKPAPVCNLIPLLELLKDLRQSQPQDLVDLARKHGAPHAERWIKKHLTDREASVLNYLLRKDKSLIRPLIEKLPENNITTNLAGTGFTLAQYLPFVKKKATEYEDDLVTKSEAFIYAQEIIETLQSNILNCLKQPKQPSSVKHVSEVMRKLLDTESIDEAQGYSSDEEGSSSTVPYLSRIPFSPADPISSGAHGTTLFSPADPFLSGAPGSPFSPADPFPSEDPYPVPSSEVQSSQLRRDPDEKVSSSESLRDCIQELVDHIEPYIYGGTPMCEAMNEAVGIFKQADSRTEKVLFILSDGESEDGDPCPIAQKLHAMGVKLVTCYLTSDDVDNPKRLLYQENPAWETALMQMSSLMKNTYTMLTNTITVLAKTHTPEDGRQTLFDMSSTMKNTHTPISYLVDAGWELPAAGASRLFVQANSMAVVNEFCETIVSQMMNGCDVLVDFLEKVPLATYINQYNADFKPKKQKGETCYANAIAATFHLAMHRIVGREGGIPDFSTICERIIREFGKHGANTRSVLEKVCPEYRLHFRKVDETGARQAINRRRPVVAIFWLYDEEWKNFSRFYSYNKKGILKRTDVQIMQFHSIRLDPGKPGGHAVVLTDCDPDCLTFMNSWGTNFADKGFFRVEDQEVLNGMEFYDVYWTTDDLTHEEKEAYKIEGTKKAKEMLEKYPSLKYVKYTCPRCNCASKIDEYFGDLLKAECPICYESFEPTIGSMLHNTLYSRN